jgi:hypothetical protein
MRTVQTAVEVIGREKYYIGSFFRGRGGLLRWQMGSFVVRGGRGYTEPNDEIARGLFGGREGSYHSR